MCVGSEVFEESYSEVERDKRGCIFRSILKISGFKIRIFGLGVLV